MQIIAHSYDQLLQMLHGILREHLLELAALGIIQRGNPLPLSEIGDILKDLMRRLPEEEATALRAIAAQKIREVTSADRN